MKKGPCQHEGELCERLPDIPLVTFPPYFLKMRSGGCSVGDPHGCQ